MKVLNPSYDTVFKFLMEDIEIAQGLISIIIDEEISELIPAPTEETSVEFNLKYVSLPMHRMDYVAIIKTKDDYFQKVSIEVQKSPFIPEIGRFRSYVSDKYVKKSIFKTNKGVQNEYLPLKTIYFIEKTFNKLLPPVLRRKGDYWDVLKEQKYNGTKDTYVELLNHDSWFIQLQLLPPDLKTEMLYILSVFAPWMRCKGNERFINIPENDESFQKYYLLTRIVNRLYLAGKNQEVQTALDVEISLEDYIDRAIKDKEEAEKQILESLQREAEAKQREAEERRQKEESLQREAESRQKNIESAKEFLKLGLPIDKISQLTGLSAEEIQKLKHDF